MPMRWQRRIGAKCGKLSAMTPSEKLAERVRRVLSDRRGVTEKRMMGVLCFLVTIQPETPAALRKKKPLLLEALQLVASLARG